MPRKKRTTDYLRFKPGYDAHFLDKLVAEKDIQLEQYYVAEDRYVSRAVDRNDPAIFFIGPKGGGKSAILQMVKLKNIAGGDRVIVIRPEDIVISPLANAQFSSPLLSDPSKYKWLFKSLWDFFLSIEILEHEFPDEGVFRRTLMTLFRSSDENLARRLLDISGKRAGSGRSITDRVVELVQAIEVSAPTPAGDISGKIVFRPPADVRSLEGDPRNLLLLVNSVARKIPDLVEHDYYILIDDLDYQWTNTPLQNAFISSLFASLAKLNGSPKLKFLAALRRRIYRSLKLEDKDKYRQWIANVNWQYEDIKTIVQRRLAFVLNCAEKDMWNGVFPNDAFRRLFTATTGVPREAIRLSALCVRQAKSVGHQSITDDDITNAILQFSEEKLEDVASDWEFSMPGLDMLMRRLKGGQKEFPLQKLAEFAFHASLDVQNNVGGSEEYSWISGLWEDPKELGRMLVNSGLLQLKEHQKADAQTHDFIERDQISDSSWFAVHPMIAPGLRMMGA